MRTEKEIVYSILNTLRGGHSNNNENISTRLIRSWIASERANLLLQFTDSGRSINDENFQHLPSQCFVKVYDNVYKKTLPRIIQFNRRTGLRIRYESQAVLMCSPTQDRNYLKDNYFKGVKRAWFVGNDLYIRATDGLPSVLTVDLDAVLFYPGDSSLYNWETDVFPLQSEILNVLKEMAVKKEGNIISSSLNDQTNNFVSDNEVK